MPDNPSTQGSVAQIDSAIDELYGALERDHWINLHAYPLKLKSADNQVVMEGVVENVAAWRRAQALAEKMAGGRWSIDNQLRRETGEKHGDRQLRDEVMKKLLHEPLFLEFTLRAKTADKVETVRDAGPGSHEIMVHVDNGAVSLIGTVSSLIHRRLAEVVTWWAYGCETLNNDLQVTPAEEDTDNEITDAVRMALEKDPMLDSLQFHVDTSDHVVTLEGLANNEEEKKYAALDVWSVPGVWDVQNRVTIGGNEPG
ncbi:BON domain-containing protein [Kineobactrum sediminis]|uniref:BON domain-containing protein n=1 Tax=Kineobactrum sediminis TaxID=1905677 RepID=A0A2N5XZ81_9GAMM|nr:BON domain-containing protein [Kineobactrum sediminis]PLW81457.1 BON domain-containing protein [Kineobactrum sediminis]